MLNINIFRNKYVKINGYSLLFMALCLSLITTIYGASDFFDESQEQDPERLIAQYTPEQLHIGSYRKQETLGLCIRLGDQDDLLYASLWWHLHMGITDFVINGQSPTPHQLEIISMFHDRANKMCSLTYSEGIKEQRTWSLELTDRQFLCLHKPLREILCSKSALIFATCSYRGVDPATASGIWPQTDEKIIYRSALSFEKPIQLTNARSTNLPTLSADAHVAEYVKLEDAVPFTSSLIKDQLPFERVILDSMRHACKGREEKIREIQTYIAENSSTHPLYEFMQSFGSNTDIFFGQQYIFVPVPKCGWSTTTRALGSYEIGRMITFAAYKQFNIIPEKSQFYERLLDSRFYKFTCVRNPYNRALSAYLDRINNVDSRLRRGETNPFRKNLGFSQADNISFLDFLRSLATKLNRDMDIHFRPQWCLTMHGMINYDKIIRLESYTEDFKEVMAQIGLAGEPDDYRWDKHATEASRKLSDHYTQECVDLVKQIYSGDFTSFGYDERPHFMLKAD